MSLCKWSDKGSPAKTRKHEEAGNLWDSERYEDFVSSCLRGGSEDSRRLCDRPDAAVGNSCVVVLQGTYADPLIAHRTDGRHGGGRAGQRRDTRDFVHHRRTPDGAVVEERLPAERGVDDQIDLLVDDLVGDVRPSFVHL